MIDFDKIQKKSPIKTLRQMYPEEEWVAHHAGFGWIYENNKGELAWRVVPLDDDGGWCSRFYIYRKDTFPELVPGL